MCGISRHYTAVYVQPKMDVSEAAARDAEKVTAQAEVKDRRFEAASKR